MTPTKHTGEEGKLRVWLENLGIEVPVFELDEEKGQVVVRVSDIPLKIARRACIHKQEFVRYWYKNGGGNRLIETPTPTPERKCPDARGNKLCTNGKDTYHEYNMRNAGCTFCGAKVSSTPESRLRDSLIEECVAIRGNKAYDGSYAAPREAFRDVLRKAVSQERERLVGEITRMKRPLWHDDPNRYLENIQHENTLNAVLALLKSKN